MSSTDRSDREIIRTEYLRVSRHDEERVGIQVGNPPEGETPTIKSEGDTNSAEDSGSVASLAGDLGLVALSSTKSITRGASA